MSSRVSAWKARRALLIGLAAVVVANAALLVSYRSLVAARVGALVRQREDLKAKVDAARSAAEKADVAAQRLVALRQELGKFYGETLGTRKERLAPLIVDIHDIAKKAGFRVESWSYGEQQVPGADVFSIRFAVSGRYQDVKNLLSLLESSERFLVVHDLAVAIDEAEPDLLHVRLTVNHYFLGQQQRKGGPRRLRAGQTGRPPERPADATTGGTAPASAGTEPR